MNDTREPIEPWKLARQAIGIRMRFFLVIVSLAGLVWAWPMLRNGTDRLFHGAFIQQTSVSSDTEFFCPMDPGVVSAWPAICPICNMDLITRNKSDAVILPEGVLARMQLTPYRVQLAGVRTVPVVARTSESTDESLKATESLWVPQTSIVHRGAEEIVYVQSMPGMLDAVRVRSGKQDRDMVQIVEGLTSAQRVVMHGAFLVDAESRLNPNLSTQYFGASAQLAKESPHKTSRPMDSSKEETDEPLSSADQAIVDAQRICPVTTEPLGSMGTPVFVEVLGQRVAICCIGCKSRLIKNPEKYLANLNSHLDHASHSKDP